MQTKEAILNYQPKIHFGSSLDFMTAHKFLSFVEQNMEILENRFELNSINWDRLV